jgi:hypothetical protein
LKTPKYPTRSSGTPEITTGVITTTGHIQTGGANLKHLARHRISIVTGMEIAIQTQEKTTPIEEISLEVPETPFNSGRTEKILCVCGIHRREM